MKLFFTAILATLLALPACAQERTISGRLTSTEDGSPLQGINIIIKGTGIGTVTDADGQYSIKVPIGSTLVFSFIGMEAREVIVTENNLQSVSPGQRQKKDGYKSRHAALNPIPRSLYQDTTVNNTLGVTSLADETPTYKSQSLPDPTTLRSIKQRGDSYVIKSDTDPIRRTGLRLQFTTSLGTEQINKLPSLQTQYAQGRTNGTAIQWIGADQKEIFSWGPLVRTLEYDGSSYPFDKNGMLVPGGTGNGKPANNYNAVSFFRTAFTNVNELMVEVPTPRDGTLIFDLDNRTRTGVIPNSDYQKTHLSTNLKSFKLAQSLTANASISFTRSAGDLLQRGANLATIVGSVYRTPVTFDNANSQSPKAAINSSEAYEFPGGTKRSHAPGLADNPYGIINEFPDNDELYRLIAAVNLQYSPRNPFRLNFNGNLDQQWNTSIFGIPPGYAGIPNGRLTHRKDNQTFANGILTGAYREYIGDGELKLSLSYQADHTTRELDRQDGFGFMPNDSFGNLSEADSIGQVNKTMNRTSHEIILNAQYQYYSWLSIRLTNRNYFSNTISKNQYTNIFPSASVSVDFADLILWSFDKLQLYGTISRTLREAPLLYSNWSYGSTTLPIENYSGFYESNELFVKDGLAPETERKFETGLELRVGRFDLELAYFNNLTKDFITPVNSLNGVALMNSATVKNFGGTISAEYTGYMTHGAWGIDVKWSKYNSVVDQVHTSDERIAIAGFESAQTVLAKGKPVGAIFGTTYVRNGNGEKIIGNDGFPLKNNHLKMIGNPIPDWTLGLSSFVQWKQWKASFLLDFKKGGEIWNGTNSILDYLGRSSNTGSLRNTANYIFEGADADGSANLIPVSFYDPTKPMEENRWVRYGWDGVGEEYVEDASWIRLSELTFSYTTRHNLNRTIKGLKFSLISRNLFLITHYSGVDPSSSLLGYSTGNGLDLFNAPATRSYGAQITIKI